MRKARLTNESDRYEVAGATKFYILKNDGSISIDFKVIEVLRSSAGEQLTWSTAPAGTPTSVYSLVLC